MSEITSVPQFINKFLDQIVFDLRAPAPDIGLSVPIIPEVNLIRIYYPISAFGEYEPAGQTYRQATPISLKQVLDSIYLFYNQPLARKNIAAYIRNPAYSSSIKTIRDVLGGKTVMKNLVPYKDGFLINLVAPS